MTLTMTPHPITSLDPTTFTVQVNDLSGKTVRGATVRMSLEMPAMAMGDNSQTLPETQAGEYSGMGRFTMAGTWRVSVTAVLGPQQATQTFPAEVR